ncbi:MAG: BLUF domain-containing protein, partial [Rhodospirillales bacterium]|nr:BLUF domain-containing protein [Rhodospirillales bacterium]
MVYRLLYISKAKRDLNDQDLGQILAVSRANNSKMDITGLLLYLDREFLQVLEGGKQEVDSLFKKISSDDRHFTVKCLQAVEVDDRLFGDWSMAYLPISPDEKRKLMGEGDFFATF